MARKSSKKPFMKPDLNPIIAPRPPKHDGDVAQVLGFEREFHALKKAVGAKNSDFQSDAHARAMYRALLASVLGMIPLAEKKFLTDRSESSGYCFSALVNQAKDLTSQIRTLTSNESQAEHIATIIVGNHMVMCVQNLMSQVALVKSVVDSSKIKESEARAIKSSMDTMLRTYAAYMQESSEAIGAQIREYLCGDGAAPAPPAKKRKAGHRSREELTH